ncbi:MAG: FKBP-type peptidyl-prolyl cis-trans isomerase [Elusimicrobia bacterium]|nr:FKBP-type peptidyl-prolyl cis-trans isomerase [Elusimicrobiota bacterium]
MRALATIVAGTLLAPAFCAAALAEAPRTEEQKILYAAGVWLAQRAEPLSLTAADLKFVQMGLKDAVLGAKLKADIAVYGAKFNDLAQARSKAKAQKTKDFLARAAKAPGAQRTASGLVYVELKPGKGASATVVDTVKAAYTGMLSDGTVFDRSPAGRPLEFPLSGVVKCWQEGIPMMRVGGRAKLFCPADLAYGEQGRPGIPGGAALVYEVELVEVVKK